MHGRGQVRVACQRAQRQTSSVGVRYDRVACAAETREHVPEVADERIRAAMEWIVSAESRISSEICGRTH